MYADQWGMKGAEVMDKTIEFDEIVRVVKPLADKYKIQEVYLFGSYARNEATTDSDLDFLVEGGEQFKLTMIFAFAEELRHALNKDVDVFEIHEVNQNSDFYKNIMKERRLVA
jgi:predicted nucleotidyltransferase